MDHMHPQFHTPQLGDMYSKGMAATQTRREDFWDLTDGSTSLVAQGLKGWSLSWLPQGTHSALDTPRCRKPAARLARSNTGSPQSTSIHVT